jgi:NAD+ synthetase
VEGGVRELALSAGALARRLNAAFLAALDRPGAEIDVVVGFYEQWRGTLYNSAAYVTLGGATGRVRHVHRKAFLPTYGLFDEERFVERGHDLRAFDTGWGRAAMLICEDAWHSLSGTVMAVDDAEVLFVSAAAPGRGIHPRGDEIPGPASASRWERLVREIADEHGVFVSLSNLVGSEGGKVFCGGSFLFGPRGDLRGRAPLWEDAVIMAHVDLADIGRARGDMPLLPDLRTALPHIRRSLEAAERRGGGVDGPPPAVAFDDATATETWVGGDAAGGAETGRREVGGAGSAESRPGGPPRMENAAKTPGQHNPSIPTLIVFPPSETSGPPSLDIDAQLVEQWLVRFLRDELSRRNMRNVVVGLSGGVDSAVTATLAARALGPEHVHAVRMPYRSSHPDSLDHAQLVIDALGIPSRTIDISAAVDGYLTMEPDASPARRGNVMARQRMIVLFDQSAAVQGLPLGTGNKSERLLGYFTWHADDSPPINPLGDLFKTQVWALARHLGVPEVIVSKPASADLISGQTDEGDFGISYAKADRILHWLTAGYAATNLAERGFDPAEVDLVRRRLEGTHWKRRLPTVALLSNTAIGESYLRPVDY